jgi:uncharacterized protein YegP (UPF0339 family)
MFEIYKDAAGGWRWRYRTANSRIMADSAEAYASSRNAFRARERFCGLLGLSDVPVKG